MDKFRIAINKFIICLYGFLITLTLIGAIRSPNLSLENVSARVFLIPILIGIFFIFYKFMKKKSYKTNLLVAILAFIMVVGLQFIFVKLMHTAIGFDVWHFSQVNQYHQNDPSYFGMYPNNMFLLIIQNSYLDLIKTIKINYWLKLDILNVVLVDISAILNVLLIKIIAKKELIKAIWIQSIWLMLTPMIIVPYSDTFVLPLVSLGLVIGSLILKSREIKNQIILACLIGILLTTTYFIKPSSIIPMIALGIVYLLFKTRELSKKNMLRGLLIFMIFIASSCLSGVTIKHIINDQQLTTVESSKEVPVIHFVDIGMIDHGGYNQEIVDEMYQQKNKRERRKTAIKRIRETLKKRGFLGYIKFLILKQGYNTSDGTFAWLKEGRFISNETSVKKNLFTEYVFSKGKYYPDYNLISQMAWVIAILLLFLGINYTEKDSYFKLSIIGGFMFLLIFEGGRSRYLIQFLPVILTELTLVSAYGFTKIKRIRAVLKNKIM